MIELDDYTEKDEFNPGQVMVNEFGNNLEENEKTDTQQVITDNIKATLKQGEESMASEFLGISNFALEKNPDDEGKVSIVPVGFDLDYRSIYTKGIVNRLGKMCFLHPIELLIVSNVNHNVICI